MISQKILDSNRRYLEENKIRFEESLKIYSRVGLAGGADREYEKSDAINAKQIKQQNHRATNESLKDTIIALERMGDGSYGTCIDCGREINEDRLTARPEASRCIVCQEKKGLRIR